MKDLPVSEILVISGAAAFLAQPFSALTEEPVLCLALKIIAFSNCGVGLYLMKKFGEALKRRNSTAVRVCRVVAISSIGTMPDRTSVRRLLETVPCVGTRVDDCNLCGCLAPDFQRHSYAEGICGIRIHSSRFVGFICSSSGAQFLRLISPRNRLFRAGHDMSSFFCL